MVRPLTRRAIVQSCGRVEIQTDERPEGDEVEVTIRGTETVPPGKLMDLFGSAPGLYKTPDEADAFLSALRDEWE